MNTNQYLTMLIAVVLITFGVAFAVIYQNNQKLYALTAACSARGGAGVMIIGGEFACVQRHP